MYGAPAPVPLGANRDKPSIVIGQRSGSGMNDFSNVGTLGIPTPR